MRTSAQGMIAFRTIKSQVFQGPISIRKVNKVYLMMILMIMMTIVAIMTMILIWRSRTLSTIEYLIIPFLQSN